MNENMRIRQVADTDEQSGSIKIAVIYGADAVYIRAKVRTPREGEELFHGRDQGGLLSHAS